jgi:hypothetical protein
MKMNVCESNGSKIVYCLSDIQKITFTIVEGLTDSDNKDIVKKISLLNSFPNPFRTNLTIQFQLLEDGHPELLIQDINGKIIRIMDLGERNKGKHEVMWDGRSSDGMILSTGTYVCIIRNNNQKQAVKVLFIN